MRRHLREFWQIWISLMGGIASVILMFVIAFPGTPGKAIGAWIASYLCGIAAALAIIHRMYMRLKELEAGGVTVARRRQAQERLRQLTADERAGFRLLLLEHRLTGDQIRTRLPGVDFVRMNQITPFLILERVLIDIGHFTDSWSIRPEWQEILATLLVPPEGWPTWARSWRHLLRLIRELRGERRRRRSL